MAPTPTTYRPEPPKPSRGDPTMRKDVDIMGVQRGAHKDGEDVCPKFVFKIPGGVQEDGTPLWGWNDVKSASCARCGLRDIDHIMLRDFTAEAMERDRKKEAQGRNKPQKPPQKEGNGRRTFGGRPSDPTAANPDTASLSRQRATTTEPQPTPMQMFELEPGVPDPLAINAYKDAEREQKERLAKLRAQKAAEAAAPGAADTPMTDPEEQRANDAFKAEVEKMVREQIAKEKMGQLAAPPTAGALSVHEMLSTLGLDQYIAKFDEEGMEMSVLVQLAKSEDGKAAVDEALKEVGVASVGHRLKIFAALQE